MSRVQPTHIAHIAVGGKDVWLGIAHDSEGNLIGLMSERTLGYPEADGVCDRRHRRYAAGPQGEEPGEALPQRTGDLRRQWYPSSPTLPRNTQ